MGPPKKTSYIGIPVKDKDLGPDEKLNLRAIFADEME